VGETVENLGALPRDRGLFQTKYLESGLVLSAFVGE
jgi:hypothetical protein